MSVQSILDDIDGALLVLNRARAEIARLGAAEGSQLPRPPPVVPAPEGDATSLFDKATFFNAIRSSKALGPSLSPDEVSGCEAILTACAGLPVAWAAYALATPVVETNSTMQPINEIGGTAYFTRRYDITGERPDKAKELGNLSPGDGAKFHGRGYVQVTGRKNYERAASELGVPLLTDPDLALQPDIAAKIMRRGMQEGWFTGRGFDRYLPATADIHQFTNARRIVNGQDRAVEIAQYALEFQSALKAGGWP